MADIERNELRAMIEASVRSAIERTYPKALKQYPEQFEKLVQKTIKAIMELDATKRVRVGIGHAASAGRLESTSIIKILVGELQGKTTSSKYDVGFGGEKQKAVKTEPTKVEPQKKEIIKPKPVSAEDLPEKVRIVKANYEEIKEKDNKLRGDPLKGEKYAGQTKTAGLLYSKTLKEAGLVRVNGQLFWKEEWEAYQKQLDESKPNEVKTPKTQVAPPSQPPTPVGPPKPLVEEPLEPKKPEPISLKNYPEVAKAEQRLDEISKRLSQGEKVTEEEVEKAGKAMLKAEKGAKLVRVKGVLYTKEQWDAYEKQLKENEPESLVSKTTAKTEEISPEILARERGREAKVAEEIRQQEAKTLRLGEVKTAAEKQLSEEPQPFEGKTQEEVTDLLSKKLETVYGTEGITKEEILQIVKEAVQNFFKGQVTAEEVNADVKERVDKAGATVEKEQGVPIAKEKTEEKVEIDYKQLEEKLREKVRKVFDEIGKSLDRAVPEDAVDAVAKTMQGWTGDENGDLFLGNFNEAEYAENAVKQFGAPALAFDEIRKIMDEMKLLAPEAAVQSVRGANNKRRDIDEKDIQAAQKYLEKLIAIEKQTAHMFKEHPTMAKEFRKLDPKFLEDPNRSFQIHREASTGTMIGRSSFKDEYGVLQKATVVVDKYGDAIATTTNRHASFFQGIARDVREFAKWSIAIALVYTPMQKLKELIDLSIRSQTLLADTIVTLGESQEATSKIFESAASIAGDTGESILGVIEGYNLALRAAGDAADTSERYRIANQLLTDSITLAKLSTLSQAEATDTLVAALKQTNLPLDQGQQLLDKWVKVTRVANVDLTTLATSFSIVGEAAMKAGLGVDELNGLIALMASQTGLSAKETGNAVRSLVSGYTTDPATKELAKFGIAVKNLDGDAREFQAVMKDIKAAFDAGLISESELNKIAYAIGGGNRRQAQVVTSIVNLSTMNRVAQESALAQGEAQRALGIELDTVATKATLLSNSFTKLAQSVGMEGGVLSGISSITTGLTWLIEMLNEVIKVAGAAGPALSTLGVASFLTKGKPGLLKKAIETVAAPIGSLVGTVSANVDYKRWTATSRQMNEWLPGYPTEQRTASTFADRVTATQAQTIGWSQKHSKEIGTGIALAMMAGIRASKGDLEGAGLIMGAGVITGLATKSNAWALVAGTIASVLATAVEKALANVGREPVGFHEKGPTEEETPEEITQTLVEALSEASGRSEWFVGLAIALQKAGQDVGMALIPESMPFDEKLNETQLAIALMAHNGMAIEDINKILLDMSNRGLETNLGYDSAYVQTSEQLRKTGGINIVDLDLEDQIDEARAKLRADFADPTNDMSPKALKDKLNILTGADAKIIEWVDALNFAGGQIEVFGEKATTAQDIWNSFIKVILEGSDDSITYIDQMVGEMKDAYNKLEVEKAKKKPDQEEIDRLQKILDDFRSVFAPTISTTLEQQKIKDTTVPQIERQTDLGEKDFNTVLEFIDVMDEAVKEILTNAEEEVRDATNKNLRKFIEIAPGVFKEITREQVELWNEALNRAKEEGKIAASPPGLQQYDDLSLDKFNEINEQARVLAKKLTKDFGYESEEEMIITRLDDKQWHDLTGDWKIISILLQDILDTEKKQLEGIYNLPANGTFWVPFQARQIEPGATGGIDTGALEAEVGTTGDQIKTAIELAAAQIADAIAVEKIISENPPQNLTMEQAQDKFKEDIFTWMETHPETETEERDRRWWVTPQPDRWASDPNSEQYKQNYEDSLDLINNMFSFEAYLNKLQPFGEPQIQDNEEVSIWQQILDALKSYTSTIASSQQAWMQRLLSPQSTPQSRLLQQQSTPYIPMSGNINTGPISGNLRDTAISQANMAIPASQQKLNMNITSNVNLRLDGRVVANVVKRYLGESLLRYSSTGGSISRSVIV